MKFDWFALLVTAAGVVNAQTTKEDSRVPMRTHTLYMPYIDQDLQNRWFDIGGDAIINANKHIALTPDRPSQTGHIWSKLPITAENWQFEVQFQVGDEKKPGGIHGDGFAIWLTKERNTQGPVFGNKDKFEGLGIAFDTYPNGKHAHTFPYVMAMLGDGRTSYDSANDGKRNQIAGCEADFRAKGHPTKARVKYYKGKSLELSLQYKDVDKWESCFVLDKIAVPASPFLGFTAMTGEVSDLHAIVSVSSSIIVGNKGSAAGRKESPKNSFMAKRGSTWGVFGKILGIGAVVGVAVVVFRMYKKDAKRF